MKWEKIREIRIKELEKELVIWNSSLIVNNNDYEVKKIQKKNI